MSVPADDGVLARRDDQPKPLIPLAGSIADLDSAYRYASALANADILPQDLRGKPSNVLVILLYGQYLGIPPVIATQVIYVVKGRPQIAGKMLLAKVREAGHKPRIVHGEGKCTVTITRGDDGESFTEEFSIEDAVTAKLCSLKDGKPYARSKSGEPLPWENHPKRMLMWRAVGNCVDVACPEVKMGFAVEGEEVPDDGGLGLAQVAAERADRHDSAVPESSAPESPSRSDDEAIAAEIADIQARHTGSPVGEPSHDEAMEADMLAYEAEQQRAVGGKTRRELESYLFALLSEGEVRDTVTGRLTRLVILSRLCNRVPVIGSLNELSDEEIAGVNATLQRWRNEGRLASELAALGSVR